MLALYSRYLMTKDAMKRMLKTEEDGQTLVEYVLLIVLIALLVITAINPVTSGLQAAFSRIGASVSSTGS
jgi:Flp pilus assembly pilin Flp